MATTIHPTTPPTIHPTGHYPLQYTPLHLLQYTPLATTPYNTPYYMFYFTYFAPHRSLPSQTQQTSLLYFGLTICVLLNLKALQIKSIYLRHISQICFISSLRVEDVVSAVQEQDCQARLPCSFFI